MTPTRPFQVLFWFALAGVVALLTGCAGKSEIGNRKLELPTISTKQRDALAYNWPKPEIRSQRSEVSRTSLVVISPSPWRSVTVINEQPASMTDRWHPFTVIESSADLAAWTTRIIITNPQPFHEWMSNGYHCEFVPWTNTVTFPGQPQQFFRVP